MSYGGKAKAEERTARGRDWPCLRQFGIFMENRVGTLHELLRHIERHDLRVMALTIVSLVAWWASEAVHAPGFLSHVIGNGMPFQSSVAPPTLLASGALMVFGLALGVAGLVRIVGSLGPGGRAAA